MKFIDRISEMTTLEKEYRRDQASFVVVYGRRRVGKTTLIREFCKGKQAIYFLATEESELQNQMAFQRKAAEYTKNDLLTKVSIQNWETLFRELIKSIDHDRLILVIDEFQYLGKTNPAFPSIMMKLWDEWLSKENIMLIVCGSLIHMMASQVLNYDSPLYGRRTAQIKMHQIPFRYYKDFMPDLSEDELIQRYAITGGVPKYIELFDAKKDIYEEIRDNILNTSSFLYEEPAFLLQKEVTEIGSYFTLIKTIAAGNHKLSKIAAAMEVKQTSISKYLTTLQDLDIIERQIPVTEEHPEKSKKGLYFIKNHYFEFWFQFIYPYRDMIESGNETYVMQLIQKHMIERHTAFVYEEICRENMWEINKDNPWNIVVNRVGRWWGNKDVEIDIVAYDSFGKDIVFGECKYSRNPKDADVLYDLIQKSTYVDWHKSDRRAYYIIYSRSGFTPQFMDIAKKREDVLLLQ